MVDDVNNITETAESQACVDAEGVDRGRVAREKREAEQRKRLEELRAHAAAAQAQRQRRDEERRRRQAELRARDDDRRQQVEERKRAIWEASVSRREALVMRERERAERLERTRAARSAPRPAFAFGSSTPRLLEPIDSGGFFWAARSTNPIDQMNFFDSLAASTSNVMFASAPLTRRASALQLDASDTENKDEPDRQPQAVMWSSVARRRTDLVPTIPAPRAPGRAYSMTRLDKIPAQRSLHSASPSMHHLNRTQTRSGETTPSRPGSALSSAAAGVVRRAASAPRKPRPASIAGTGVNTPRGGGDTGISSCATTPSVSRDGSALAAGDVPRRPATTPRRPRPASLHVTPRPAATSTPGPGEGKPPLHRKPKSARDIDRASRGKSLSVSPGRTLSPSPGRSKEASVDKDQPAKIKPAVVTDKSQVSAAEVTHKLEALQIESKEGDKQINENVEVKPETKIEKPEIKLTEEPEVISMEVDKIDENQIDVQKPVKNVLNVQSEMKETETQVLTETFEQNEMEIQKPAEKKEQKVEEKKEEKLEEKKELSQERTEESEMTTSMSGRRITTEEEAKAALAERRRRAREELERQAELERQRLQREAEEEAERQRVEEERQRREEEEARELAAMQRRDQEEKLQRAIEAQQQLEREEAERKSREEAERQARLKEDEEKRKAAEEAEKLRKEEAEREEKERLVRKQRVEAIMARTRFKKGEEEKKNQENKVQPSQVPAAAVPAPADNGNQHTSDLLGLDKPMEAAAAEPSQLVVTAATAENGNTVTVDLLGLDASQTNDSKPESAPAAAQLAAAAARNNGNAAADLLGLSAHNEIEDTPQEQTSKQEIGNAPSDTPIGETNNGNVPHVLATNVGHISADFIQTERNSVAAETQAKMAESVPKILEDDFTTHNGHNHPLTLQNAI